MLSNSAVLRALRRSWQLSVPFPTEGSSCEGKNTVPRDLAVTGKAAVALTTSVSTNSNSEYHFQVGYTETAIRNVSSLISATPCTARAYHTAPANTTTTTTTTSATSEDDGEYGAARDADDTRGDSLVYKLMRLAEKATHPSRGVAADGMPERPEGTRDVHREALWSTSLQLFLSETAASDGWPQSHESKENVQASCMNAQAVPSSTTNDPTARIAQVEYLLFIALKSEAPLSYCTTLYQSIVLLQAHQQNQQEQLHGAPTSHEENHADHSKRSGSSHSACDTINKRSVPPAFRIRGMHYSYAFRLLTEILLVSDVSSGESHGCHANRGATAAASLFEQFFTVLLLDYPAAVERSQSCNKGTAKGGGGGIPRLPAFPNASLLLLAEGIYELLRHPNVVHCVVSSSVEEGSSESKRTNTEKDAQHSSFPVLRYLLSNEEEEEKSAVTAPRVNWENRVQLLKLNEMILDKIVGKHGASPNAIREFLFVYLRNLKMASYASLSPQCHHDTSLTPTTKTTAAAAAAAMPTQAEEMAMAASQLLSLTTDVFFTGNEQTRSSFFREHLSQAVERLSVAYNDTEEKEKKKKNGTTDVHQHHHHQAHEERTEMVAEFLKTLLDRQERSAGLLGAASGERAPTGAQMPSPVMSDGALLVDWLAAFPAPPDADKPGAASPLLECVIGRLFNQGGNAAVPPSSLSSVKVRRAFFAPLPAKLSLPGGGGGAAHADDSPDLQLSDVVCVVPTSLCNWVTRLVLGESAGRTGAQQTAVIDFLRHIAMSYPRGRWAPPQARPADSLGRGADKNAAAHTLYELQQDWWTLVLTAVLRGAFPPASGSKTAAPPSALGSGASTGGTSPHTSHVENLALREIVIPFYKNYRNTPHNNHLFAQLLVGWGMTNHLLTVFFTSVYKFEREFLEGGMTAVTLYEQAQTQEQQVGEASEEEATAAAARRAAHEIISAYQPSLALETCDVLLEACLHEYQRLAGEERRRQRTAGGGTARLEGIIGNLIHYVLTQARFGIFRIDEQTESAAANDDDDDGEALWRARDYYAQYAARVREVYMAKFDELISEHTGHGLTLK